MPTDQPTPDLDAVRRRLQVFVADADAAGEHRVAVYREDVRALLAALDAVTAEHRDFTLALVEALGPCAPEHDGTDAIAAVKRLVAENAVLRERLHGWTANGVRVGPTSTHTLDELCGNAARASQQEGRDAE